MSSATYSDNLDCLFLCFFALCFVCSFGISSFELIWCFNFISITANTFILKELQVIFNQNERFKNAVGTITGKQLIEVGNFYESNYCFVCTKSSCRIRFYL